MTQSDGTNVWIVTENTDRREHICGMTEEELCPSPSPNDIELRVLLRHYWKKGLSARAAADEICQVEGEGTVGKTAAIKWFRRLKDGDLDLDDKPRSGRPPKLSDDDMCEALEHDLVSSTRF